MGIISSASLNKNQFFCKKMKKFSACKNFGPQKNFLSCQNSFHKFCFMGNLIDTRQIFVKLEAEIFPLCLKKFAPQNLNLMGIIGSVSLNKN